MRKLGILKNDSTTANADKLSRMIVAFIYIIFLVENRPIPIIDEYTDRANAMAFR